MSQPPESKSCLDQSPAAMLRDPEVKKFFLGLLQSNLPPEDTYAQFVRFFELRAALAVELSQRVGELQTDNQEQADRVLGVAAHEAGVWQPQKILEATRETLGRALRRLRRSQHGDGGWGYEPERSSTWATVYAALALFRADELAIAEQGAGAAARLGIEWLLNHRREWSIEEVPETGERSIYELSAVLRCLLETRTDSSPEVRRLVTACMLRLTAAQNDDGGWDRSVWGDACSGPVRVWSEVGATSFALQALAAAHDPSQDSLRPAIARGLEALARAQHTDGSWSVMLHPRSLAEGSNVSKTCDAINGLLAGKRPGFGATGYERRISRAVEWLEEHESPIFTETMSISGWGWTGGDLSALENTCHTLETLLRIDDHVRLPLLTSSAIWLMRSQHRQPEGLEDGKWSNEDTGRITLSLLEFYRVIEHSPLFAAAPGDAPR